VGLELGAGLGAIISPNFSDVTMIEKLEEEKKWCRCNVSAYIVTIIPSLEVCTTQFPNSRG